MCPFSLSLFFFSLCTYCNLSPNPLGCINLLPVHSDTLQFKHVKPKRGMRPASHEFGTFASSVSLTFCPASLWVADCPLFMPPQEFPSSFSWSHWLSNLSHVCLMVHPQGDQRVGSNARKVSLTSYGKSGGIPVQEFETTFSKKLSHGFHLKEKPQD